MNFAPLEEGFVIMLTGMGVVFSFLITLIIVMIIMAKVIKILNKFCPEVVPEQKTAKQKRPGKDEEEIAIAIALAIRGV